MARELAPNLAVYFRPLVKRHSFPAYCRLADVDAVPKNLPLVEENIDLDYSPPIIGIGENRDWEVE